ncbi:MAG TPA: hypothetical protein VFB13_12340 [Reyranella sp.]|nr:hypothetical protein [Reyranella sp.]
MPGFYSIKTDGWKRVPVSADVNGFSCLQCKERVDVIIGYNPPKDDLTNEEFLLHLATDSERRRYLAKFEAAFKAKGQTFELVHVQLGQIAGSRALLYNAKVITPTEVGYIAAFSGVQKHRIFTIQIGSHDEHLSPETIKTVNDFLATLSFEK